MRTELQLLRLKSIQSQQVLLQALLVRMQSKLRLKFRSVSC